MNDENKQVALEKAIKLLNNKGLVKITSSSFEFNVMAHTWCWARLETDFLISDGSDGSDQLRLTDITVGLSNEVFSTGLPESLHPELAKIDSEAHSDHIKDLELKIVLRIAYLIYKAVKAADSSPNCDDFNKSMNLVSIFGVDWNV